MYSYISLKCNCPICGASLMDSSELVDDIPSIKLTIKDGEKKGTIRLSAFYGSYNYQTDLTIEKGKEYLFYCPYCYKEITSERDCDECGAKMIPLKITEGGVVRFCSRAGCKKHNIEFEDLSQISTYLLDHVADPSVVELHNDLEKEVQKEIIKTGTFLRIYCPNCEKGLVEKNSVIFKIENEYHEKGYLLLSPYLNVFKNKSTIFIPEGAVVKTISCPFCDFNLISKDIKCEKCGAPAVHVEVAALRQMIDFYFCSKKGCHWHSLSQEDLQHVMLEDSIYW